MALPLTGKRVLCVEDHADTLELMKVVLGLAGAFVHGSDSPQAALAAVATMRPDILLTDIAMPDFDGFELLRRVREVAPELPVIAVSGHAHASLREKAREAGFADVLTKPLAPGELVAAV